MRRRPGSLRSYIFSSHYLLACSSTAPAVVLRVAGHWGSRTSRGVALAARHLPIGATGDHSLILLGPIGPGGKASPRYRAVHFTEPRLLSPLRPLRALGTGAREYRLVVAGGAGLGAAVLPATGV